MHFFLKSLHWIVLEIEGSGIDASIVMDFEAPKSEALTVFQKMLFLFLPKLPDIFQICIDRLFVHQKLNKYILFLNF